MPRNVLIAIVVAACAVPLAFSAYTDPIWEDSFITLRHSENLLKGEGLLFNPGERIHGFTSPINVLLLALSSLLAGQTSFEATFWVYRIFCIAAFAAGAALVARRLWEETPTHPLVCAGVFALFYVFDMKMVTFTSNGMETAFMLLFLGGAISLLVRDDPAPWIARGLYWGGLMWSRPDGCIYIAALSLADYLFRSGPRRTILVSLLKSGALCTIVYLPWFAFAWWYYGSPVPHTVIAKGQVETGVLAYWSLVLGALFLRFLEVGNAAFLPVYNWFECLSFNTAFASWLLYTLARPASVFCLAYALFPVNDRLGRAASLCFSIVTFYFSVMMTTVWPWYLPPATLLAIVTLSRGIVTLSDAALRRAGKISLHRLHPAGAIAISLLVAGQIALCGWNAVHTRIKQSEIEMGNRYPLSMWLHDHGRPEESVYLEPLGYIGYFSGMRMIDWPGLVSPQVVAARRERGMQQFTMIFEIHPDWVVLRQKEFNDLGPLVEKFGTEYELEAIFDVTEQLKSYGYTPSTLYYDARYGVFRRRDLRPADFKKAEEARLKPSSRRWPKSLLRSQG